MALPSEAIIPVRSSLGRNRGPTIRRLNGLGPGRSKSIEAAVIFFFFFWGEICFLVGGSQGVRRECIMPFLFFFFSKEKGGVGGICLDRVP